MTTSKSVREKIQLYLASSSPRRRELLSQLGLCYEVITQNTDERKLVDETPEAYVRRLAVAKARAGLGCLNGGNNLPVLGSDTIVVSAGQILGKPVDQAEAAQMLNLLAGRSHQVLTAVAIVNKDKEVAILSNSVVQFREISSIEIDNYWLSGEPVGKAGGYAIQGLGALFIEKIEGSYSGIKGLPLFETAQLLGEFGMDAKTILAGTRLND